MTPSRPVSSSPSGPPETRPTRCRRYNSCAPAGAIHGCGSRRFRSAGGDPEPAGAAGSAPAPESQVLSPQPLLPDHAQALLALADGTVFIGRSIGATGETTGQVVFNT